MRSSWIVLVVVAACGKDKASDGNRAKVEAFVAKLVAIEAKLDAAPSATEFAPPGEPIRAAPGKRNVVIVPRRDFAAVLNNQKPVLDYRHEGVDVETDTELRRLIVWTRGARPASDLEREAYQRVLDWYPNVRYAAVIDAKATTDFTEADTSVAARWDGRVLVYDLQEDRWVGAAAVTLQAEPPTIRQYEYVGRDGKGGLAAGPQIPKDVKDARTAFAKLRDRSIRLAIETGKQVLTANEVVDRWDGLIGKRVLIGGRVAIGKPGGVALSAKKEPRVLVDMRFADPTTVKDKRTPDVVIAECALAAAENSYERPATDCVVK